MNSVLCKYWGLTLSSTVEGSCQYDGNGNLTNSHAGRRVYVYDDENRLQELYVNTISGNPDKATEFVYDGLGRLRIRREYTYNPPSFVAGADWMLTSETRYAYDGWRVIQERDVNNAPLVSYTRGTDLSGTLEGAGGIGGLLGRSHGYSSGTGNWSTHNFYRADGNGNITYMVNSSQSAAATYRYDPYGNLISSSGTLANGNVYRFSSKEVHVGSGLYYYGHRFYEPNFQRWLNRDPIQELGGINLFGYVLNSPIDLLDILGLDATVEVNGNKVKITIVIAYTGDGATADVVKKFNAGIEKNWTGKFGDYDVTTTVQKPTSTSTGINTINVPSGTGRAECKKSADGTDNEGTWPAKNTSGWDAAHEAGHLMGLRDKYTNKAGPDKGFKGNIMAEPGGKPSKQDITNIIQANNPNPKK